MITIHYDEQYDFVVSEVNGHTTQYEMINMMGDVRSKFKKQEKLFILMDMANAEILIDAQHYVIDMQAAKDAFMKHWLPYKKLCIAHLLRNDDKYTKVLIDQFLQIKDKVPSFIPEIFYDRVNAIEWLQAQKVR